MKNRIHRLVGLLAIIAALCSTEAAAQKLKPFVLVSETPGEVAATVTAATGKLKAAGFEIAGSYQPYPDAAVIVVTNDALRTAAGKSEFGAYGAGMRVSVTKINGKVQLAYTNPTYIANAYRMNDDLADAKQRLAKALGTGTEYGPKEGIEPDDLREYHYMFGMEYFTDPVLLNRYLNHQEALDIIEANLKKGKSGLSKVYRIDIPGKQETVFGVAMAGGKNGKKNQDDAYLMSEIDFKDLRSTAHLPYELVVAEDKAFALNARFRIAINFPDLAMTGANSFMNIMGAPDAIASALTAVSEKY
jgi:hypothetical protein